MMATQTKRSPPKVGDVITLLVPPFITGLVSEVRQGKYCTEVRTFHIGHGTILVDAEKVRVLAWEEAKKLGFVKEKD